MRHASGRAGSYFVAGALVSGTNLTGSVRRVVDVPSSCFSTTSKNCTSCNRPVGITIRPPGLSWSINGCGIAGGAAVTTIESKGAASGQPL